MKKITNYKIQITNKSQITMSKITNPIASMHPCNHASMQSCNIISHFPNNPSPHSPKSRSQLTPFSTLPSFPPGGRRQRALLFLLLLCLPIVLYPLSDPGQAVTGIEEKLKTAAGKEKIRLLLDFANNYRETEPKKSLTYAKEALRLAEKAGDPEEIFNARNTLGACYHANTQSRMAVRYYLEALKLEPHINNKNLIADVLSNIGIVYWRLDDNVMAEKYHLQALEIRKRHGAPKASMALTFNNLGLTAREKGDIAGALRYYQEALNLYAEINHKRGVATTLNNIAILYKDHSKDPSKAPCQYMKK
jgi:tetratricopeptide (TPR) repeat protein